MTSIRVVHSLWLACLSLLSYCQLAAAGELVVFPSEVSVSVDYPARFVVLEKQADESWIDRTHARELELSCDPLQWLTLTADRSIEVSSAAAEKGVQGAILLRLAGQEIRLPVRIASGEQRSPAFPREVAAVLGKAGCNLGVCHGNLHGKAGFRLSLRGDDPALDFAAIVRGSVGRRIDRFVPSQSLLLRKPLGEIAHQGGMRFDRDSTEAKILRRWIEDGCQWNADTGAPMPGTDDPPRADETLVQLDVYPPSANLAKACRTQQLVVVAHFADGTQRDVTRWARYEPSVVTGVEIDSKGCVTASEPVDVSISISYLTGRAASRLTFLAHTQSQWSVPPAQTRLDELVEQKLRELQVLPAPLADDYVFLRRAYLAVVGRVPTAEQVRVFADSTDAEKRARLVETLLHDQGYAFLWSMRWSDLLRNEQKVMSQSGAEGWHAWMTNQIARDQPLNEFVAQMLTTLGSTYDNPAAGFHRTHRDPESAAESVGQVFLGVRLQCVRCHNHPFDRWRQDDYYGLAAYFTTVRRKQVENDPKDKFDKHIISGDEVYLRRLAV